MFKKIKEFFFGKAEQKPEQEKIVPPMINDQITDSVTQANPKRPRRPRALKNSEVKSSQSKSTAPAIKAVASNYNE